DGRLTLLGLWGDAGAVEMALHEEASGAIAVFSLDCPGGRFPSVAARHVPALRFERAIHDLWGLVPEGLPDTRPWLDHGRWGVAAPLGADVAAPSDGTAYAFLPSEGDSLHQVAVGPVHAGTIEPGHFRFTV